MQSNEGKDLSLIEKVQYLFREKGYRFSSSSLLRDSDFCFFRASIPIPVKSGDGSSQRRGVCAISIRIDGKISQIALNLDVDLSGESIVMTDISPKEEEQISYINGRKIELIYREEAMALRLAIHQQLSLKMKGAAVALPATTELLYVRVENLAKKVLLLKNNNGCKVYLDLFGPSVDEELDLKSSGADFYLTKFKKLPLAKPLEVFVINIKQEGKWVKAVMDSKDDHPSYRLSIGGSFEPAIISPFIDFCDKKISIKLAEREFIRNLTKVLFKNIAGKALTNESKAKEGWIGNIWFKKESDTSQQLVIGFRNRPEKFDITSSKLSDYDCESSSYTNYDSGSEEEVVKIFSLFLKDLPDFKKFLDDLAKDLIPSVFREKFIRALNDLSPIEPSPLVAALEDLEDQSLLNLIKYLTENNISKIEPKRRQGLAGIVNTKDFYITSDRSKFGWVFCINVKKDDVQTILRLRQDGVVAEVEIEGELIEDRERIDEATKVCYDKAKQKIEDWNQSIADQERLDDIFASEVGRALSNRTSLSGLHIISYKEEDYLDFREDRFGLIKKDCFENIIKLLPKISAATDRLGIFNLGENGIFVNRGNDEKFYITNSYYFKLTTRLKRINSCEKISLSDEARDISRFIVKVVCRGLEQFETPILEEVAREFGADVASLVRKDESTKIGVFYQTASLEGAKADEKTVGSPARYLNDDGLINGDKFDLILSNLRKANEAILPERQNRAYSLGDIIIIKIESEDEYHISKNSDGVVAYYKVDSKKIGIGFLQKIESDEIKKMLSEVIVESIKAYEKEFIRELIKVLVTACELVKESEPKEEWMKKISVTKSRRRTGLNSLEFRDIPVKLLFTRLSPDIYFLQDNLWQDNDYGTKATLYPITYNNYTEEDKGIVAKMFSSIIRYIPAVREFIDKEKDSIPTIFKDIFITELNLPPIKPIPLDALLGELSLRELVRYLTENNIINNITGIAEIKRGAVIGEEKEYFFISSVNHHSITDKTWVFLLSMVKERSVTEVLHLRQDGTFGEAYCSRVPLSRDKIDDLAETFRKKIIKKIEDWSCKIEGLVRKRAIEKRLFDLSEEIVNDLKERASLPNFSTTSFNEADYLDSDGLIKKDRFKDVIELLPKISEASDKCGIFNLEGGIFINLENDKKYYIVGSKYFEFTEVLRPIGGCEQISSLERIQDLSKLVAQVVCRVLKRFEMPKLRGDSVGVVISAGASVSATLEAGREVEWHPKELGLSLVDGGGVGGAGDAPKEIGVVGQTASPEGEEVAEGVAGLSAGCLNSDGLINKDKFDHILIGLQENSGIISMPEGKVFISSFGRNINIEMGNFKYSISKHADVIRYIETKKSDEGEGVATVQVLGDESVGLKRNLSKVVIDYLRLVEAKAPASIVVPSGASAARAGLHL